MHQEPRKCLTAIDVQFHSVIVTRYIEYIHLMQRMCICVEQPESSDLDPTLHHLRSALAAIDVQKKHSGNRSQWDHRRSAIVETISLAVAAAAGHGYGRSPRLTEPFHSNDLVVVLTKVHTLLPPCVEMGTDVDRAADSLVLSYLSYIVSKVR